MRQVKVLHFIEKISKKQSYNMICALVFILMCIVSLNTEASSIKIGVTSDFNYKLVNFIKSKNKDLDIDIINYDSSKNLNKDIISGDLDLNLFQTLDTVNKYNEKNMYFNDVEVISKTYIEAMGVYSKKNRTIKDIRIGASIAIPKDASNKERALILLEKMGLIKLNIIKGSDITQKNIVENPFDVDIVEVDKKLLPRYLEAVDYALLISSTAVNLGYNPVKDSLFLEEFNPKYVNVVVTREKLVEDKKIKNFLKALDSQEVKLFILEKYKDNISFQKN